MSTFNYKFLGLLILLFSFSSVVKGAETCKLTTVKWHPGHYLLVYAGTSDRNMTKYIEEIKNIDGFRGMQRRYTWKSLEPSMGVYDFSVIKKDLNALAAVNKRLVIQLQAKSFGSESGVPNYIKQSAYDGGVYATKDGGTNVRYWNSNVQDRLKKLVTAMGNQLDSYSNLEAINFVETASSMKDDALKERVLGQYIFGILKTVEAAKEAFPSTVVLQYINYPPAYFSYMVSEFTRMGVGLGGPDTYIQDPTLINGAYKYISGAAGTLPIGMAVQHNDYESKAGNGGTASGSPSIQQLHLFAQDNLKSNYMFWARREKTKNSSIDYYGRVVNYLGQQNFNRDPAGGLATRCPDIYASCIIN